MKTKTRAPEYCYPCKTCQNQKIVCDRIVGRKSVALVLDYPTNLEASKGKLLQGDTGRLIRATLKALDVDERDVNVITALNCKPNTAKPKLLRESMACCRARLLRELRALGTEKVLCLGTIGYTALTSTDKIARMDKVHGRWVPTYGMWMIGTYSPTRVIMDPELYRDWIRAFEKFFNTDGREPWPYIDAVIPETFRELREELDELGAFTPNQLLSLDIETLGFSPIDDEVVAIGIGREDDTDGTTVIINYELLKDERTWWLITDQLEFGWTVLHNGKFDLKFIVHKFRELGIDYVLGKIEDSMLLNYGLDERPWGKYGAHSLKNISRVRYDAPDYDINVGEWIKKWKSADDIGRIALEEELHTYLALDCYYTARLGRDLRADVTKESTKLLTLYEDLLIPASNVLSQVELRGIRVDKKYLIGIGEKVKTDLEDSLEIIREYVGYPKFNPTSSKQVHELLYSKYKLPILQTGKKGKARDGPTSQPVIRLLRKKFPEYTELFNEIIKWRQLQKVLGTYIYGFIDRIGTDGRIHGDYLLHGSGTGRLSSVNPNLQNVPEESHFGIDLRKAFIPENEDWIFIEGDYAQLELRCAAHLTGDENFIQVYVDDGDLHKDAADAMFKKSKLTPYERKLAKSTVFGAMYDRGPESLAFGEEMDYLEDQLGGHRWSLQEMKIFFKRFFELYPGLAQWQREMKQQGYTTQVLENELGRLRRFPFINRNDNGTVGRQSINTPIQSLASDITLDAMVRIQERFNVINRKAGRILAHVVITIHDSIGAEVHKSVRAKAKRIMKEEMETVPIDTVVPFKIKISEGPSWGECK